MSDNKLKSATNENGQTIVNTIVTDENIIDLVTANDVLAAYSALPEIQKVRHLENDKGYKRGVIQQIQTLTINVGSNLAGVTNMKCMLVIQWYKMNVDYVNPFGVD